MNYEIINKKFNIWLSNPLQQNNEYIYDKDILITKDIFINNFIFELEKVLDGCLIKQNKEFRDEIASFIYKYSNE